MIEPKLKQNIIKHYELEKSYLVRRNLAATFIYSFEFHENKDFKNFDLDEIDIRKIEFVKSKFELVKIVKSKLEDLKFRNCVFNSFQLEDCSLLKINFKHLTGEIIIKNSFIENSEFSEVTNYEGFKLLCSNVNFYNIKFKKIKFLFSGQFSLNKITSENSEIYLLKQSISLITESNFNHSIFDLILDNHNITFQNSNFNDSIIYGLTLSYSNYHNIKFNNCEGIILTQSKKLIQELKFEEGIKVLDKSKKLIFIDKTILNKPNLKELLVKKYKSLNEDEISHSIKRMS